MPSNAVVGYNDPLLLTLWTASQRSELGNLPIRESEIAAERQITSLATKVTSNCDVSDGKAEETKSAPPRCVCEPSHLYFCTLAFWFRKEDPRFDVGWVITVSPRKMKRSEEPEYNVEVHTRCFTKPLYEVAREYVRPCHREILDKTPFGVLVDFPPVDANKPLAEQLVNVWSPEDGSFQLGEVRVQMRAADVSVILGLPLGGKEITLDGKEELASWVYRHIPDDQNKIHRNEIREILQKLSGIDTIEAQEDFVRFFILFMCTTIFFQRSNYGCPIQITKYLENIDEIRTYSWSKSIHQFLINSVADAHQRVTTMKKERKGKMCYLNGAVIVLSVWFYERTSRPSTTESTNTFPRLFRWKSLVIQRSNTYKTNLRALTEHMVCFKIYLEIFPIGLIPFLHVGTGGAPNL